MEPDSQSLNGIFRFWIRPARMSVTLASLPPHTALMAHYMTSHEFARKLLAGHNLPIVCPKIGDPEIALEPAVSEVQITIELANEDREVTALMISGKVVK